MLRFFAVLVVLTLAYSSTAVSAKIEDPAKLLSGLSSKSKLVSGSYIELVISLQDFKAYQGLEVNIVSKKSFENYPQNVVQCVCSSDSRNSDRTCPSPARSTVNAKEGIVRLRFFLRPTVFRFSGPVSLQLRAWKSLRGRSANSETVQTLGEFVVIEPVLPRVALQSFPNAQSLNGGDEISAVVSFANIETITYSKLEVVLVDDSSKESYPRNVVEFVCTSNRNHAPEKCPAIVSSFQNPSVGVLNLKFVVRPAVYGFVGKVRLVVRTSWTHPGGDPTTFDQVLTTFQVVSVVTGSVEQLLPEDDGTTVYKIGDTVPAKLQFGNTNAVSYSDVEIGLITDDARYPRSVIQFVCSSDADHSAQRCPPLSAPSGFGDSVVDVSFQLRPNVFEFTGTARFYVKYTWLAADGSSKSVPEDLSAITVVA